MNSRHLPLQASFSVLDISPLPAYAIHPIGLRPVIFLTTATSALSIALSTSRCTRKPYDRYCSPDLRAWGTFEKKSCRGSRFLGILTRCPAHRRHRTLM